MRPTIVFVLLLCATLTAFPQSGTSDPASYRAEIDAWHAKRIEGLKREHGWLSLIALDWLEQGTHPVPGFGTLQLTDGTATLTLDAGRTATVDGKPFAGGLLMLESDSTAPTKVVSGTRAFIVISRGGRHAIRMWDSQSPVRTGFHTIERFPVSTQWRITARWEAYAEPKHVQVETVIPGLQDEYQVPGAAVFTVNGTEYRLEPVVEKPGDDLFFIFGDKTNGKETYPAGRFLYSPPTANGTVVLDFNKAYNPPCAFTPFATCPLPSRSNRLTVRVEAGEKNFGKH